MTVQLHTTTLLTSLDAVWNELISLVQKEDEKTLNKVPFKNSWTVLQVLIHITKSNNAILQGLQMQGQPAERDPEQNAGHIKNIFLDFTVKYQSPAFIVPEKGCFKKEEIINALQASIAGLQRLRTHTELDEIIDLPAFGAVTKLELFHFVLYHTQRHIWQITNIITTIHRSDTSKASDRYQ